MRNRFHHGRLLTRKRWNIPERGARRGYHGLRLEVRMAHLDTRLHAVLQLMERMQGWIAREVVGEEVCWKLYASTGKGGRFLRLIDAELMADLRHHGLIAPEDEPAECPPQHDDQATPPSPSMTPGARRERPPHHDAACRWVLSGRGWQWLQRHGPAHRLVVSSAWKRDEKGEKGEKVESMARTQRKGQAGGGGKNTQRKQGDGDKERQRMLIRDAESGRLREVEVNVRENPLMWLARRKDASGRPYLEPHHVAAGERLRQDYEIACMQPHVTASWNPALVAADRGRLKSGPRDPFPFAERVVAARQRVRQALEAIGDDLADVVSAVCCLEQGIEAAERHLNWPRRSARLVLRIALERLARHYGLRPAQERRAGTSGGWQRALHWHADDGLPTELMPQQQADEAAGGNT